MSKIFASAKARGGNLFYSANVREVKRVDGMGLYSLFGEYPTIRIIDRELKVKATLTYQPAGDTLASNDHFSLVGKFGEKDLNEVIKASDTCSPASARAVKAIIEAREDSAFVKAWLKANPGKTFVKASERELTASEKSEFASELAREPRTNTWHGIEHALGVIYPSAAKQKSEGVKVQLASAKETNEKSRKTFIRIARLNGHEVSDDISLKDVMALFENE